MARTPQRTKRPTPRRATSRTRPSPRTASNGGSDPETPVRRTWLFVGGAILAVVLIWRVVPALLGGGTDVSEPPDTSRTSSTGPILAGEAPPPPQGARSTSFPAVLEGTRLQLKVITLGDDPRRCRAALLEVGGDRRAVFHHHCVEESGLDRYFFFVRLVNLTDGRVTVELDRFEVASPGGARVPLDSIPGWSSSEKFFPPSDGIVPGGSLKGWITVDGTDGFLPKSLTYADGEERLTVEFDGRWIQPV
jgi:hypothetical protein